MDRVVPALALSLIMPSLLHGCGAGETPRSPRPVAAAAAEIGGGRPATGATGEAEDEGFVGVVVASRAVHLTAESRGRLVRVPVKLGDEVESGDVVAVLEATELQHEIASAEAALRAARASQESARIEWERARQRAERRSRAPDIFSDEEMADVRTEAQVAAARVETAESEVAQQEARVEGLLERRGATRVRSPIDGKVAGLFAQAGELVEPGSRVARIVSDGEFVVRFAAPPERANQLEAGEAVTIRVVPLDLTLPGRVEQVSPATDPVSEMVFAEASLSAAPSSSGRLQDGQSARVTVDGGAAD